MALVGLGVERGEVDVDEVIFDVLGLEHPDVDKRYGDLAVVGASVGNFALADDGLVIRPCMEYFVLEGFDTLEKVANGLAYLLFAGNCRAVAEA